MVKKCAFFRADRVEITGRKTTSKGAMKSPATFFVPNLTENHSASYQTIYIWRRFELLASIEEQTLQCPLISLAGEGECLSKLWFTMKHKPQECIKRTRQKFSFALRLEVSIPSSPSLRFSRLVILFQSSTNSTMETIFNVR